MSLDDPNEERLRGVFKPSPSQHARGIGFVKLLNSDESFIFHEDDLIECSLSELEEGEPLYFDMDMGQLDTDTDEPSIVVLARNVERIHGSPGIKHLKTFAFAINVVEASRTFSHIYSREPDAFNDWVEVAEALYDHFKVKHGTVNFVMHTMLEFPHFENDPYRWVIFDRTTRKVRAIQFLEDVDRFIDFVHGRLVLDPLKPPHGERE